MILKTENSTYELDESKRLLRRVSGDGEPTYNFGKDGIFKQYNMISIPKVGTRLGVIWNSPLDPDWDGVIHTSRTTIIQEIEGECHEQSSSQRKSPK